MPIASVHHTAVSRRAYLYLALVPICSVAWTVLILFFRAHLGDSSIYRMIDSILYLSAVGVFVLVAIPIRFRKLISPVKLVTVSLLCGLILAFVTFMGYMTVGFG